MKREIKVIHQPDEANPFLVIYKPHGIPSAPLAKDANCETDTALSQAIKLFPEIKNVCGILPHEYGLLHRIDNDASGLILIATTQKSFDAIFAAQKEGNFIKKYKARCDNLYDNINILTGFPFFLAFNAEKDTATFGTKIVNESEPKQFVVRSAFRPFGKNGKEVRPVTENSGKAALKKSGNVIYETRVEISPEKEKAWQADEPRQEDAPISEAVCTITRGFRHQVRCHLAWAGFPVIGDRLYNALYRGQEDNATELQFEAFYLEFPHPITNAQCVICE